MEIINSIDSRVIMMALLWIASELHIMNSNKKK